MNFCNKLTLALRQIASPEDAISMRAYMKENFHYLGVKTEARRQVLKELIATCADEVKIQLQKHHARFISATLPRIASMWNRFTVAI